MQILQLQLITSNKDDTTARPINVPSPVFCVIPRKPTTK